MKNIELQNKLTQKLKEQFSLQVHSQIPQYIQNLYDIAINNNANVKDILKNNNPVILWVDNFSKILKYAKILLNCPYVFKFMNN